MLQSLMKCNNFNMNLALHQIKMNFKKKHAHHIGFVQKVSRFKGGAEYTGEWRGSSRDGYGI